MRMLFKLFLKWYYQEKIKILEQQRLKCQKELEGTDERHMWLTSQYLDLHYRNEIVNLWKDNVKMYKKEKKLREKISKYEYKLSK